MKRYIKYLRNIFIVAGLSLTVSCASYLDVVPDLVGTIDYAFSTRNTTEKFLVTCYSYLPSNAYVGSLGMVGANEIWGNEDNNYSNESNHGRVAQGAQNTSSPYFNVWDGTLFTGIRDCNIFLEKITTPLDIEDNERKQWIAEVKFLKAYYHFYLLQLYGPIPIIDKNLEVSSTVDEVRIYREPVDDVVDYIVKLLDEALPDLMLSSGPTRADDAGRITRAIAAAIKAKVLVTAASPRFNGTENDPPEFSLVDKRGVQLFPREYKAEKWTRALEAVRQAVDISHEAGHRLYKTYTPQNPAITSDRTKQKFALRAAITEKFNNEIIWPETTDTHYFQIDLIPNLGQYYATTTRIPSNYGPTLKVAEEFYTRNGIPIEEDEEWIKWIGGNITQRYEYAQISTAEGSGIDGESSLSEDHRYDIGTYITTSTSWDQHGRVATSGTTVESTSKLHFYREPRFYAWIGFDRGIWEIGTFGDGDIESLDNSNKHYVLATKAGEDQGKRDNGRHMTCGYFAKKLVHLESWKNQQQYYTTGEITYPIIRLSDLYLLYAETLNETKQTPDAEVYRWIDSVRIRAGLKPVKDAWNDHAISTAKNKPLRKDGMRDIIKRERIIELSFESQKFFDLMRWKDALDYLNQPVQGWNFSGGKGSNVPEQQNLDAYYTVTTYMNGGAFNSRNYFWPISKISLRKNNNLKQNPGWEEIDN